MIPAIPPRHGFHLPFIGRPADSEPIAAPLLPPGEEEVPDSHTQLEELIGHVRRCERWARLDDLFDMRWKLEGLEGGGAR